MMYSPAASEPNDELLTLLADYCNGTISEPSGERLVHLLRVSEQARRAHVEYLDLHLSLRQASSEIPTAAPDPVASAGTAASTPLPHAAAAPAEAARDLALKPPVLGFLGAAFNLTTRWLASPRVLAIVVASSLLTYFLMLAISIAFTRGPLGEPKLDDSPRPLDPVARITGTNGCRWRSTIPQLGASLEGQQLDIAEGLAELTFAAGARVLVEGPANLTVESSSRIRLDRGKLTARAPRAAAGFTVATPCADVVDLGTEFGVSVSDRGVTETEVFDGTVEVHTRVKETDLVPQAAAQTRRLTAGQAVRIDATAALPRIESVPARPQQFSRQLIAAPEPGRQGLPTFGENVIAQSHPALYWTFDTSRNERLAADRIRAHVPDRFQVTEMELAGPRPADGFPGMAPQNCAVSVSGAGGLLIDLSQIRLGGPGDKYSLQMWFKSAAAFESQQHHYLLGRGEEAGQDQDTVLLGGAYLPDLAKTGHLVFCNGEPPPVAGKTMLAVDQWHLVTLVRDGRHVCVYLDGQPDIVTDCDWRGGAGQRISVGHRPDFHPRLGLNGRFDEVAIWNRALSAQEVMSLYRLAKAVENTHQRPGS